MENQLGYLPQEAIPPQFPDLLTHLWNKFVELQSERSSGGMGPGPITSANIKAWCELTGHKLYRWEVDAIKQLDATFLSVQAESRKHG